MSVKAVFLDRDDTLNLDPGYLGDPKKVQLYEGVPEGLSLLKKNGFKLIVVSNQSGVARGLIKEENVEAVNNKINELLSKKNVQIDDFYYCPYHPKFNTQNECKCRKPSPELVLRAAKDHKIDLNLSYFVGDKISDVECGNNAGIKTVIITNSLKVDEINRLNDPKKKPNFVALNFLDACDFIMKDFTGGDF